QQNLGGVVAEEVAAAIDQFGEDDQLRRTRAQARPGNRHDVLVAIRAVAEKVPEVSDDKAGDRGRHAADVGDTGGLRRLAGAVAVVEEHTDHAVHGAAGDDVKFAVAIRINQLGGSDILDRLGLRIHL